MTGAADLQPDRQRNKNRLRVGDERVGDEQVGDEQVGDPNRSPDDVSEETASFANDAELAELERLYQEALETMEAVEADLSLAAETVSGSGDIRDEARTSSGHSDADSIRSHEPLHIEGLGTSRTMPVEVIEAALFVGATALTTKRICSLLGNGFDSDFVEVAIAELNDRYAGEGRPYEIRFGEGGYRLVLRAEFERIRNRVFGLGPREIKLSQEALEILAVVAYHQPISRGQLKELGKENAEGMLRQLLRRELIVIERDENDHKQVRYRTTPRFLQLFGLGRLDELPQTEDISFK